MSDFVLKFFNVMEFWVAIQCFSMFVIVRNGFCFCIIVSLKGREKFILPFCIITKGSYLLWTIKLQQKSMKLMLLIWIYLIISGYDVLNMNVTIKKLNLLFFVYVQLRARFNTSIALYIPCVTLDFHLD